MFDEKNSFLEFIYTDKDQYKKYTVEYMFSNDKDLENLIGAGRMQSFLDLNQDVKKTVSL